MCVCVCVVQIFYTHTRHGYLRRIKLPVYSQQGFIQDFLLGGGNVFSHASTKHINVGGSGGIPLQERFFKLSFSEVDFSAILLCVHTASNAVKSCRCERE